MTPGITQRAIRREIIDSTARFFSLRNVESRCLSLTCADTNRFEAAGSVCAEVAASPNAEANP